jgi:hypothetical protein
VARPKLRQHGAHLLLPNLHEHRLHPLLHSESRLCSGGTPVMRVNTDTLLFFLFTLLLKGLRCSPASLQWAGAKLLVYLLVW